MKIDESIDVEMRVDFIYRDRLNTPLSIKKKFGKSTIITNELLESENLKEVIMKNIEEYIDIMLITFEKMKNIS